MAEDRKQQGKKNMEPANRENPQGGSISTYDFSHLVRDMAIGVVYQDASGAITHANGAAQDILGLSLDQMQGRKSVDPRWKAIHEDGSDFTGEQHPAMVSLREGKRVQDVVMGVFNPATGSYRWIRINSYPEIMEGESKPYQVFTTFQDISEQKQADEMLKSRLEELDSQYRMSEVMASISSRFINLPGIDLDLEVNRGLADLGSFRQVDRAYVFMIDPAADTMSNTHEWCAQGIQPEINNLQQLPCGIFPWWMDLLKKNQVVYVYDVAEMPVEAVSERSILESQGVQSVLAVTLTHENRLIGFVGFDSVREKRAWTETSIQLLRMVADAITNAFIHRQSDEELERVVSNYRLITENSEDVIWVLDVETGKFTYVSPSVYKLRGYTPEEVLAQPVDQALTPESMQKVTELMGIYVPMCYRGEIPPAVSTEMDQPHKDGRIIPTEVTTNYVFSPEGRLQVIGITRDITERKKTRQELEKANERYRLITENTEDVIWVLDVETRKFTYVSPSVTRVFGYSQEEALSLSLEQTLSAKSARQMHEAMEKEINMWKLGEKLPAETVELEQVHKDGRIVFADVTTNYVLSADGRLQVIGISRDITERKLFSRELEAANERYKLITDNTLDMVWVLDAASRRFEFVSPSIYKLSGFTVQELLTLEIEKVLTPDSCRIVARYLEEYLPALIETGVPSQANLVLEQYRKDGSTFPIEVTGKTVISVEGKPQVVGISRDITERLRTMEEVQKARQGLENAQALAHMGSWELNPATGTGSWSREMFHLFNLEPVDGVPALEVFLARVHPDDRLALLDLQAMVLTTGEKGVLVYRAYPTAGEERFYETTLFPVVDAAGKISRLSGTVFDITEKYRAQEQLKHSQATLAAMINGIKESVFLLDLAGTVLQANEYGALRLKSTVDDLIGRSIYAMLPPELAESRRQKMDLVRNTGQPVTFEDVRDGTHILNSIYPVLDSDGNVAQYAIYGRDITDIHDANIAVRESESRLKQAQAIAKVGSWELDLTTNVLLWSDEIYRIFDLQPQEFKATYEAFLEAIHPDDREMVNKAYGESLTNKQPYDIEHRVLTKKGTLKYVRERCQTTFDPDGKPVTSLGTVQDITEQRLTSQALKESESRLNLAQAMAHIGSWEYWYGDEYEVWSDENYRIHGFEPAEFKPGKDQYPDFIHPDDRKWVKEALNQSLTSGKPYLFTHRVLTKDGKIKFVEEQGQTEYAPDGKPIRTFGTVQDVTDERLAAIALEKSESRLNQAQAMAYIGSWEYVFGEDVENWSDENYRILGFEPREFIPAKDQFLDFVHPDDRQMVKEEFDRSLNSVKPYLFTHRVVAKDGTIKYVSEQGQTDFAPDGTPVRTYGTMQDVTAQVLAEQDLRAEKDRLESLASSVPGVIFTYRLAHGGKSGLEYVSKRIKDLYGFEPERMYQNPAPMMRPMIKEELKELNRKLIRAARKLEQMRYEFRYMHPQKGQVWLEITASPVITGGGDILFSGIIGDITERKNAEQEVNRYVNDLGLINSLNQSINRSGDVKEISRAIFNYAQQEYSGTAAAIYLVTPDRRHIRTTGFTLNEDTEKRLEKMIGRPIPDVKVPLTPGISFKTVLDENRTRLYPNSQGISARIMDIIESDRSIDKRFKGILRKLIPQMLKLVPIKSYLSIPLVQGGEAFGLLEISFNRLISEKDVARIEMISSQVTAAMLQKQAEIDLRTSNERFAEISANINEAFWITDRLAGRVIYLSPAFESVFGISPAEYPDDTRYYLTFVHPDDVKMVEQAQHAIETGKPSSVEYRFRQRDGSHNWVRETSRPVFDEDGKLVRTVGVATNITAAKAAAEEIRQANERFELVNKNIRETFWVTNRVNKKMEFLGNAFESTFGIDRSLVLESPDFYSNHVHPDDLPFIKQVQADIEQGKVTDVEYRWKRPDGQTRWIKEFSSPVFDKDGSLIRTVGISSDITEEKEAQEQLKHSESFLQSVVASSPGEILTINREGFYTFSSRRWQSQEEEEFLSIKFIDQVHPDFRDQVRQKVEEAYDTQSGRWMELMRLTEDASYRWYDVVFSPVIVDGQVTRMTIFTYDIHERKMAEMNLAASEARYRMLSEELEKRVQERTAEVQDLYENAPTGYHSTGPDKTILMMNLTELDWLGYDREEVVGRMRLADFMSPESRASEDELFRQLVQTGSIHDVEMELVRKDGSILPVIMNAVGVYDEAGNFLHSRSTISDNTERKAAQDALRESEASLRASRDQLSSANAALIRASKLKDEFLASMSHELRTPLTGILGLSEALQLETYGPLNDKQRSALANVESSGRHLLELINDILDLSKIEADKLELNIEQVAVSEACQAALQLTKGMAHKKNQLVSFTANPASAIIRADPRRLKQMVVNLLSNAIKFTGEGGSLGVEVNGDEANHRIYITVWDKGMGIKPEDLSRLFKPFIQLDSSLSRQHSGTGLGLSLVARLAELHGGGVSVESSPGEGSRFTITLPWIQPVDEPAGKAESQQLTMHRCLMVEDNEAHARQISGYLNRLGIEYMLLDQGEQVLETALVYKPDLILLDLNLPGISGADVLKILKSNPQTADIVVIISSVEDDRHKYMSLGALGYLVKPFSSEDLRKELIRAGNSVEMQAGTAEQVSRDITVLFADDNEIVLSTVSDYLRSQGYNMITARSGTELVELAEVVKADLILTDIQMPGMDGLEAIRHIRASKNPALHTITIIAITALAMPGDEELCIEAGANGYFSKPIPLPKIMEIIDSAASQKKRPSNEERQP